MAAMPWTPEGRVYTVDRLSEAFARYGLLGIDERGNLAKEQPGVYFGCGGLRRIWSGQLISPHEQHWKPVTTIFKAGYTWKLKDVHPQLGLRMRDLRRCGITPSHAAKLVLEHYYREG